ncbi:RHS repeat-associated core domain-containing protein, partial [Streptomyces sp. NRRL F-5053]|uniref:RHS repeat-associated core domain-containing protein n=1 Tax=Streptomyces sp. NRRL F-5053 TaxID=1463854 RepID=UPI001331153A
ETGLHYNYFRHYDPDTARYLTPDPLGLTPAPNPAAYVHNPHTWTDVLGLNPCTPGSEDDARLALDRSEELQSMRNDFFMADKKGTTAVIGVFNSETKEYSVRIGINGSGPMPPSWSGQLRPGEEFIQAPGHAEEGILNSLGPNEHAVYGAASRNFCKDTCLPLINTRGTEIGGVGIRGHKPQNSPYTLFWAQRE